MPRLPGICALADTWCTATQYTPITWAAGPEFNVYDIHAGCPQPPLCYDVSNIERYLNLPQTQEALGVHRRSVQLGVVCESCSELSASAWATAAASTTPAQFSTWTMSVHAVLESIRDWSTARQNEQDSQSPALHACGLATDHAGQLQADSIRGA